MGAKHRRHRQARAGSAALGRRVATLTAIAAAMVFWAGVSAVAQTADASPPAAPAQATPSDGGERLIPFDEFRALSDGKTLHFLLEDGTPWGREYYVPGTQDSVFVFDNGECFEGYWTYDQQYYCYFYRDEPSCWTHFWEEGRIKVESRSGMRQIVGRIVDQEPLSCEPELLSALDPTRR